MVGVAGFEPTTFCTPWRRRNARYASENYAVLKEISEIKTINLHYFNQLVVIPFVSPNTRRETSPRTPAIKRISRITIQPGPPLSMRRYGKTTHHQVVVWLQHLEGLNTISPVDRKWMYMNEWVSSSPNDLPDFLIAGAMKCGTSTLHWLLDSHPDIHMPRDEIGFFDIDDVYQHSDFWVHRKNRWHRPSVIDDPDHYWRWYREQFKGSGHESIVGEDSTTYLASARAFERIAAQPKPIKIIVSLRHPVDRAYSQYWHELKAGRARYSFEDTVTMAPHMVLGRSEYRDQIARLLRHIPREQIFFFVLEDFLADRAPYLNNVFDFLGADPARFDNLNLDIRANLSKTPRAPALHRVKNAIMQRRIPSRYSARLGFDADRTIGRRMANKISHYADRLSLSTDIRPPAMRPGTRDMLDSYFSEQFRDLNDLVGFDLRGRWFE
ncbi:sulfotransferase [Salinisphaera sp. SPP-AMP-43]|uniref:sulfotransferase n=1 Tax=Salinisphaera sp. SPP-AMP-43 TaxID=3121288 RepID=UPI003C6E6B18